MNWENLESNAIAVNETAVDRLQEISDRSPEAILHGGRDSGKTVTAMALGFRLLTRHNYACFYGNLRDLSDVSGAVQEIQAYEEFHRRALFILEDCHTSTNLVRVETLLEKLGGDRHNTVLLLTTRQLGPKDSILRSIAHEGAIVRLDPEELRAAIAKKYIEHLSRQPIYATAQHFPGQQSAAEDQINELLAQLPRKNLRILDLYLQAWDPRTEPLTKVDEKKVLGNLLRGAIPLLSLPEAQNCFLPLCAIDQYEIGVRISLFDHNAVQQLSELGVVYHTVQTGLFRLADSSEASWYLRAAAQAQLLQLGGSPSDISTYVRHHVLRYGAEAQNPQDLLRALRSDNQSLSSELISDQGFQENIAKLVREPFFRPEIPDLLFELRIQKRTDLCLQVLSSLSVNVLGEIANTGVKTVGRLLSEFTSWDGEFKDQGLRAAQQLLQQPSLQPKALANDFMAGVASGRYEIPDLVRLVYNLNRVKTFDIRSALTSLDLARLKARFPGTSTHHYMALLRAIKYARVGIDLVRGLTPNLRGVRQRLRGESARALRDTMDALLMPDKKGLWASLTDQDLRDILSRSTLNQLYNFLEDAFESLIHPESKPLGRAIASRLVGLDLSMLMAGANTSDVSMFVHVTTGLNPDVTQQLLEQVIKAGLKEMLERDKDKDQAAARMSFMLKDFSVAPHAARRFLLELYRLDLLPYLRASSPVGFRHFAYWALMTDEEVSRAWFLAHGAHIWEEKIREALEEETFWLLLTAFQMAPHWASSLADLPETKRKLAEIPYGLGMLQLCGATAASPAAILSKVPSVFVEPLVASKCAFTLKALCHPDLREAALQLRFDLELRKIEETLQGAETLPRTKELFVKILGEFRALA